MTTERAIIINPNASSQNISLELESRLMQIQGIACLLVAADSEEFRDNTLEHAASGLSVLIEDAQALNNGSYPWQWEDEWAERDRLAKIKKDEAKAEKEKPMTVEEFDTTMSEIRDGLKGVDKQLDEITLEGFSQSQVSKQSPADLRVLMNGLHASVTGPQKWTERYLQSLNGK